MGLIKFFKKLFAKKVIQIPTKKQDVLIQPQSQGYTTVDIGQKLLVEEGWNAVIVAKDSVLDVFKEGTYELTIPYLPKTTKALSLDKGKVVKNGDTAEVVLPKRFKCDIYFVRTEYVVNRNWQSGQIKVREKGKKNFKYSVNGTYSFQVEDAGKAVGLFLIDWAKIKAGKAILKLDDLVGELLTDVLWSKKFKSQKDLTQYEFGNVVLKPYVFKNFKKYGISVTDVKVNNIIYPQNMQTEHFEEVVGETLKETEQQENLEIEQEEYAKIEENGDENVDENMEETEEENTKIEEHKKIPFYSFEEKSLKCENCGAELPCDSIFCNKCGKKIEGE